MNEYKYGFLCPKTLFKYSKKYIANYILLIHLREFDREANEIFLAEKKIVDEEILSYY